MTQHTYAAKKQTFNDDEIDIYDEAVVYKRGEYWQMRMWLGKEKKCARFSLRTCNRDTAIDKVKKYYHELMAQQLAGKTYFSKTTKQGVEEYLKQRALDVEAELIIKGRYGTIKTHLEHWLEFIGQDTKLKELERTDCENYLHSRAKTKNKINVSQATGDEALRRSTFEDDEIVKIKTELEKYIADAKKNIKEKGNLARVITGYYLLISIITGLRRGEQLQLKWSDIKWLVRT